MAAPKLLLKAGQEAFNNRISMQLAASQTFVTNVLVALSNSSYGGGVGYVLPFTSSGTTDLAFAVGRFDAGANANGSTGYGPVVTPATDGTDQGDVTQGVFKMANGSGGNALTAANIGLVCYTADGATANATSATNLLPGGSTGTGILAGVVISVNQDGDGFVLVQSGLVMNTIISGVTAIL